MRVYTTIEQARELPLYHREIIPEAYRDAMGHMNVRHYMALFDDAGWKLFESFGMTAEYYQREQSGGFELRNYITYIAEVHIGETVAVHVRAIGCSETRIHLLYYLINESTNRIAATMEAIGAHADLRERKITPYPQPIHKQILQLIEKHAALDWEAPLCGILRA